MSHMKGKSKRRIGDAEGFRAAQREELKCWRSIEHKLSHPKYLEIKKQLWERVAERADLRQILSAIVNRRSGEIVRIADIGCGPAGVLVILPELLHRWFPRQDFQFIGVDPLIGEYLKLSPILVELPVEWRAMTGENLSTEIKGNLDIIFCNNAIDHVLEIESFTHQFLSLLSKEGFAIVSVNCHTYRYLAKLWSTLRLETLHPFQKTAQGYTDLFSHHGGNVEGVFSLEDLYGQFDRAISGVSDLSDTPKPWSIRRFGQLVLEMMGLPLYGASGQDRAIFHHNLFLISPEQARARSPVPSNASAGGPP